MGKNWNEEGYCEGEVKYRQIANNRLNARKTVNRQDECGKWYTNNTAEQSHSTGDFSRDFYSVANEFACQGLELDMPPGFPKYVTCHLTTVDLICFQEQPAAV